MNTRFWPTLMAIALTIPFISPVVLAAPKAPAHQLQARQVRMLKALQTPIAVPGYVPVGCELYQASVSDRGRPPLGPGEGPEYALLYRCPDDVAFTLRGESGGFGGPDGDKKESVWNPVFGKIPMLIFVKGGQFGDIEPYYFSDWIGKGPIYFSLISGHDDSTQLPLPEARKVLQNLTLLK